MANNRALAVAAGAGLVGVGLAVWWFTRKPAGAQDPVVTGYLAQIAAATTRTELEAVRGLIFPYVLPIVYPTSYLATGFEVDFFEGRLPQSEYNTLFAAYQAKLNTLPAYVTRHDQLAAAKARRGLRRVTIPAGVF
jgi:hypothetical protein